MLEAAWHFLGGIHPANTYKTLSNQTPIKKADLPDYLAIPLQQHIGSANQPLVKVGDRVLKGQIIAKTDAYISAPIHASTSGKIIGIKEYPIPHPSGLQASCILIEPDGLEEWQEDYLNPIEDYRNTDPAQLRQRIREAGIVGMGGAAFPTSIKANALSGSKKIDTILLNGAECEPYITCDDRFMREHAEDIFYGLEILLHLLQAPNALIGIEDNKPEAIDALEQAKKHFPYLPVEIVVVPTIYPAGGEKQLIQSLTGKEVPSGKRTVDVGIVCFNIATTANVYYAIRQGKPLISRITTVTGEAVTNPGNFATLIGTPFSHLIKQAGGHLENINRLIMGGPMMGFKVASSEVPVIKATNSILAMAKIPPEPPAMPCIRCGACTEVCPAQLLPQQLYWYSKSKDLDKAREYHIFDCIECGCCSYVCPSHIPLVQYYRASKNDIAYREREKQKSDLAKRRFEFRQQRIEQEKLEKEAKRKAKRSQPEGDKQKMIQEALERAKAKKQQNNVTPKNTDHLTETQQTQIQAADKRRESNNSSDQAS